MILNSRSFDCGPELSPFFGSTKLRSHCSCWTLTTTLYSAPSNHSEVYKKESSDHGFVRLSSTLVIVVADYHSFSYETDHDLKNPGQVLAPCELLSFSTATTIICTVLAVFVYTFSDRLCVHRAFVCHVFDQLKLPCRTFPHFEPIR